MRRHGRRRGAKVTGEADPEGNSPEMVFLGWVDGINGPADDNGARVLASGRRLPRDLRPHRALH